MNRSIVVDHLYFRYKERDRWILEDISLELHPGHSIILTGPNGVGKTTLISLLLGIFSPQQGKISRPHQKRLFSYLPQGGRYDVLPMRVLDVLTSVFLQSSSLLFFHQKEYQERSLEILRRYDLEYLAYKKFGSLSGGQMQKVLLCRIFLSPSPFIVLDEPFSNMDQESKILFASSVQSLKAQSAILIISHDMEFISRHEGVFWYLSNAKLKYYDSIDDMDHAFFHNQVSV